ncbi:MAG: hypothetical protein ICV60_18220 [Pyrinomonadaceae bacterium]|nr:hypothetical protein [Pyrinomonadaceae bacterium]
MREIGYRPALLLSSAFISNNNELLPYKLKPSSTSDYSGVLATIDSDGYRVVAPHVESERKVLLLGDSVVFGYGLNDDETIPSQLQRLTKDQVVNIGVPGYSSWNEYAALKDYLEIHNVSKVILLYIPNDITFDNNHGGIGNGQFNDTSNSSFHRFLRFMYAHFYISYLISDRIKAITNRDKTQKVVVDWPALDYSMQATRRIKELCQQNGIDFQVGIYRDIWYYSDKEAAEDYERRVSTALESIGVRCFVIKSHIDNLKLSEARVAWNDPHPSATAAKLIAEEINLVSMMRVSPPQVSTASK